MPLAPSPASPSGPVCAACSSGVGRSRVQVRHASVALIRACSGPLPQGGARVASSRTAPVLPPVVAVEPLPVAPAPAAPRPVDRAALAPLAAPFPEGWVSTIGPSVRRPRPAASARALPRGRSLLGEMAAEGRAIRAAGRVRSWSPLVVDPPS